MALKSVIIALRMARPARAALSWASEDAASSPIEETKSAIRTSIGLKNSPSIPSTSAMA